MFEKLTRLIHRPGVPTDLEKAMAEGYITEKEKLRIEIERATDKLKKLEEVKTKKK
jgi:hypothetical protein